MQIDISIIIPTKNAGAGFDDGLSSIYTQKTNYTYEVIVIDSGSTDSTLDIVAQYPIRLIIITPEEFGHGKTRNFGARLATGKYLVYLTQDALAANENWLDSLITDMGSDDEIAGAYSRTIPRSNCDPFEARYIAQAWGDKKEIKEITDYKNYKKEYKKIVFFSNVSSCIRKDVWKKIPFSENLIMAEDQDWSKRVLEAGYKIAYEPKSVVYHSHIYSLKELFKRYCDAGTAHKQVFGNNNNVYLLLIPVFAIIVSILDLRFMWRRGYNLSAMVNWTPKAVVRHLIEAIGFWRGLHFKYSRENGTGRWKSDNQQVGISLFSQKNLVNRHIRFRHYTERDKRRSKVVIALTTSNRLDYTKQCLDTLFKNTQYPYQLVIVDDNSNDGTRDYLKELKGDLRGFDLILNSERIGTKKSINFVLAEYEAEYYIRLDNDILVPPGWLEEMIKCLERHKEIGVLGLSIGQQMHKEIILEKDRFVVADEISNFPIIWGMTSVITSDLIDRIGFLDDQGMFGFDDALYCIRAGMIGFQCLYYDDRKLKAVHLPGLELGEHGGIHDKNHISYSLVKQKDIIEIRDDFERLRNKYFDAYNNYKNGLIDYNELLKLIYAVYSKYPAQRI